MPDWTMPMEGGCRCDRVRFRVTAPPILTAACHCTGCQKMSASAFSLSATFAADAFELIQGETVTGGVHGDFPSHQHCDFCKSWMFTRVDIPGMPMVNVRPTMFDEHGDFTPFIETWTREKLPWASTAARHSYETEPESPDAYLALSAQFAKPR